MKYFYTYIFNIIIELVLHTTNDDRQGFFKYTTCTVRTKKGVD
jgi:hypothetical protein